jgi:isoquinoline 1-oxidoreductase subunit beta
LSAALMGEITIDNDAVKQASFDTYPVLCMREASAVEADPTGCGEPGVPPTAPAVANAIFAATGKRIRRLPIHAEDLRST